MPGLIILLRILSSEHFGLVSSLHCIIILKAEILALADHVGVVVHNRKSAQYLSLGLESKHQEPHLC